MNRRAFLRGVVLAPAVILTPGLLMPVRPLAYTPEWQYVVARLDAQFATVSFWLKAADRATRERIVRGAARITMDADNGAIHFPWTDDGLPPVRQQDVLFDHVRIETDAWKYRREGRDSELVWGHA